MQDANMSPRGEPDLGNVRENAKNGDGGKVHRIHNDRSNEGLEVGFVPEEVAKFKSLIPAPQTDARSHQTERARAELAA